MKRIWSMLQFRPIDTCQKLTQFLSLSVVCYCQMRCMNHRKQSAYDLWLIWIIDICLVAKSLLEHRTRCEKEREWANGEIWLILDCYFWLAGEIFCATNEFKNTCVCVYVLHTKKKASKKEYIPTDRHLQQRQSTAIIKNANGRRGWTIIKCLICRFSTKLNTELKLNGIRSVNYFSSPSCLLFVLFFRYFISSTFHERWVREKERKLFQHDGHLAYKSGNQN